MMLALAQMASGLAQSPASLTDLGPSSPAPGPWDVVQLSTAGNTTFPDGLNYYTDNETDHTAGEPGQTFVTPAATNGFVLSSLALKSAGLDSGGGSPGGAINYLLHVYSVSGGNVSLLASYISASPVSYAEGDWLQWAGLSVTLSPGTAYAFSFGKAQGGGGWDAIGVSGGNPYSDGEISLIPPVGGAMTFGSSHGYDAIFDIALISAGPPTPPVVMNLPPTAVQATAATLNGRIVYTGGNAPAVTLYFGGTDAGTNAGTWQHAVSLGAQSGVFALSVPALAPNTTYFYNAFASNSGGGAWASASRSFTTASSNPVPTSIAVLTYHNDNTRDGANTNETALTLNSVQPGSFGRLFSYAVDGHIYAQPLVMTNVAVPGQGVHDAVYVATEHDTVYAFDANGFPGTNGGLLWSTNLGTSAAMPNNDFGNRYGPYHDLVPEVGITGTPVIDRASGTLYLDAFTHDGPNLYHHRIHALEVATGHERPYGPVLVVASFPGHGVGNVGGAIVFAAEQHLQRPALTLAGGIVYVAYGSYADTDPYHGWVLGFSAANLQLLSSNVFNTTPNATTQAFGANAGEGAIWMGGDGLCVDGNTNLYFETANGSFSQNTNGADYGDSFVKLSTTNGLKAVDYFTPYNQANLQADDTDLGSGGPLLLPDDAGNASHQHLIVGAGKEGKIHLLDRDNLGRFNSADDSQVVQELPGELGSVFGVPAYFNHLIFYQAINDVMKAFSISNAHIASTPASQGSGSFGFPGATPAVSAEGSSNAIVWAIQNSGGGGPAVLHAYNATNLAQELYNSSQNLARDNPGAAVKLAVPTIAGGKVYVGAQKQLSVFGTGIFLTPPVFAPDGGAFSGSVVVSVVGAAPGVESYYTIDGSAPTTNSPRYTGPFVLTNSARVQAIAAAPGAVNSVTVGATFTIVPPGFFTSLSFATNGQFLLGFSGLSNGSYVLQGTTDFVHWATLSTTLAPSNQFHVLDSNAPQFRYRFYRMLQQ
jgi:hypothetical protein